MTPPRGSPYDFISSDLSLEIIHWISVNDFRIVFLRERKVLLSREQKK